MLTCNIELLLIPICYRHNSNPSLAKKQRSKPDTWVTDYTGDIGNTFALNGFSMGSSLQVS